MTRTRPLGMGTLVTVAPRDGRQDASRGIIRAGHWDYTRWQYRVLVTSGNLMNERRDTDGQLWVDEDEVTPC